MTIEALIFDLDNTLVNRKLAFKRFSEQFINQFVVTTDQKQRAEIVEYIIKADRDGYRKKRELYDELLNQLEMKIPGLTVDTLLNYWFSEFSKCTVLMDGALEVLQKLKSTGIKLGLITNGSVHSQNSKIDKVQIRTFFDAIVVSDEVRVKKPDKQIFKIALQRLNVNPPSSLYVGDHPLNDIQGAREAGITPIWFKGFMDWDDRIERPEFFIDDLRELINIVKL